MDKELREQIEKTSKEIRCLADGEHCDITISASVHIALWHLQRTLAARMEQLERFNGLSLIEVQNFKDREYKELKSQLQQLKDG